MIYNRHNHHYNHRHHNLCLKIFQKTKKEEIFENQSFFPDPKQDTNLIDLIPTTNYKISLKKLAEICENDNEGMAYIMTEYGEVEKESAPIYKNANYTSAKASKNAIKNRYINILPPEESRVVVPDIDPYQNDYVNANWIDGTTCDSKKRYVATQGPTENTMYDFWSMVWNTNVSVIVMLTRLIESEKIKCHRYWPDENDKYFTSDRFEVYLEEDEKLENGTMEKRKFKLVDKKTNESRKVTQLQFLAWPDHGVLDSPGTFLTLAEHANQHNHPHGPILIHCSAGVGRTGTFVVIQNVLEKLLEDSKTTPLDELYVDIPSTLLMLRKQRSYSVQTPDQYVFCYKTIYEGAKKLLNK